MAWNEERLQQQLQEAMQKQKEGEEARLRAEEREKTLEGELRKLRENLEEEKRKSETKDAELRKLSKSGFPVAGSFQWDVDMAKTRQAISEDSMLYSPYTLIDGLSFRIGCKTEMRDKKWLLFCLCCNDNSLSKTYSATVAFTLGVISRYRPKFESFTKIFNPSVTGMGWLDIGWDTTMLPEIGRIHNGHITIDAQIKVIWCNKNALIDFSFPDPEFSDVILIVGGKKFHVDKKFIAHFSGYFKTLFCSGFAEKTKKEIELKDIDGDEFEAMLGVIYPQKNKATAATVVGLLRMADFFDVRAVTMECTEFLKASCDFSLIAKLQLTEEFRLPELQHHLVEGMRNTTDSCAVINSADFRSFSVYLQNSLLEKHFKLSSK